MHPELVTTEHVKLLHREMQMKFQLIIFLLTKQFYKPKIYFINNFSMKVEQLSQTSCLGK